MEDKKTGLYKTLYLAYLRLPKFGSCAPTEAQLISLSLSMCVAEKSHELIQIIQVMLGFSGPHVKSLGVATPS